MGSRPEEAHGEETKNIKKKKGKTKSQPVALRLDELPRLPGGYFPSPEERSYDTLLAR